MRKPFQSPGRMKNSSYYIAQVGVRTHDLPHSAASNMVKVPHAPNHGGGVLIPLRASIWILETDMNTWARTGPIHYKTTFLW